MWNVWKHIFSATKKGCHLYDVPAFRENPSTASLSGFVASNLLISHIVVVLLLTGKSEILTVVISTGKWI